MNTSERLPPSTRAERELVVGLLGARLEVEQRAHDRAAAGAPRRAAAGAPRGRTRARRSGRRARRRPAPRRPRRRPRRRAACGRRAARPSGRPASTSSITSRSCSTRYWLLIGRPHALGGAPVDLADVVVGLVVADRLELGAQPERPARQPARPPEAALADGEREPARRRQVGVDRDLVLARAARGASGRGRAGPRCAARPRRARGGRAGAARPSPRASPSASRGSTISAAGAGWRRRTRPSAALGRHAQRRRDAAREVARHLPRDLRGGARTASASAATAPDQHERREPADRRRRERRQQRRSPARIAAARGAGLIAARAPRRARCGPRRSALVALQLGLGREHEPVAQHRRAPCCRRRRASRSRGRPAAPPPWRAPSRWTAARGLAPSATLGSSRVRRTTATT